MKILIISDSHRNEENIKKVLLKIDPIDHLIHLGDAEGSEDYIAELAGCPLHIVAGNNDFFSDLPREQLLKIGEYRIFLAHGHYHNVTMGPQRIRQAGLDRQANIVMYGHTHRPYLDISDEITVLNPGSISFPRQDGRKPSYILMELDRHGEAHYTINYLKR